MLYPGFSCASNLQNILNDAVLCNSPCHGYTQPSWRSPKLCFFQQLTFGIALTAQSSVPARLSLQIQELLLQPWQRQLFLHLHLQAGLSSRLRSQRALGCHSPSCLPERGTDDTLEYLSSLWLSWEHRDSPQDLSTWSLRRKCFSRGILLKKYLNICFLLCCCVKRHQKADERVWSLHNPLTPPHYKLSQNSLMN